MRSRSRRDAAPELSLPPLGSAPGGGDPVWDAESESYVLSADRIQYRVEIGRDDERSSLLDVEGRVDDGPWRPLLRRCGMLVREAAGAVLPPLAASRRCELLDLHASVRGRALSLEYVEQLDDLVLQRRLQLRLLGRSLEIQVEAEGIPPLEGAEPGAAYPGYCGFSLGPLGPEGALCVPVPGLVEPLVRLEEDGFLGGYAGRFCGRATAYPPGAAFYRPDREGRCLPIQETFYLTLSPEPLDPLPTLRREPGPYVEALRRRVTLDLFSEAPYVDDEALVRRIASYGLRDVLLIYRNWQRFGYRRREPALYPANPERGSNEAFRRMLTAAHEAGWIVALREEYASLSADCPYRDDAVIAAWPDGQPRRARRDDAHAVKAERMLDFARLEATQIQRNYRPGAVFVDGHTAWSPEGGLRQADAAPHGRSAIEAQAVQHVEALLHYLRDLHAGPVIGAAGEGPARFDTFAGGMADAIVRGPDEGVRAPLLVDYELQHVRPALLGIGASSYRQFTGGASEESLEPSSFDADAYRATQVALGHAGYVGSYGLRAGGRGTPLPGGSAAAMVREYYLLRALQELYLEAAVRSIRYRQGNALLSLAEALRAGADLAQAQVRIEYEGGLTVWVNRAVKTSWTFQHGDAQWTLPPSGFLAGGNDGGFIAYSAANSGNRADFCRCAAYTFLDTRSPHPRTVEGITVDGSVVLLKSAVAERQDVVLVGVRQLKLGEQQYWLSDRGDVRLEHLAPDLLELTVLETETGKPIHVAWPAFSPAWKAAEMEVLELEAGEWQASRSPVQQTRSGPQLHRASPGVSYRVRPAAG